MSSNHVTFSALPARVREYDVGDYHDVPPTPWLQTIPLPSVESQLGTTISVPPTGAVYHPTPVPVGLNIPIDHYPRRSPNHLSPCLDGGNAFSNPIIALQSEMQNGGNMSPAFYNGGAPLLPTPTGPRVNPVLLRFPYRWNLRATGVIPLTQAERMAPTFTGAQPTSIITTCTLRFNTPTGTFRQHIRSPAAGFSRPLCIGDVLSAIHHTLFSPVPAVWRDSSPHLRQHADLYPYNELYFLGIVPTTTEGEYEVRLGPFWGNLN